MEKRRIDVRVDPELYDLLDEEARRLNYSINRFVGYLCRQFVDEAMEQRSIVRQGAGATGPRSALAAQIVADGHNSPTLAAAIKRSREALADDGR